MALPRFALERFYAGDVAGEFADRSFLGFLVV